MATAVPKTVAVAAQKIAVQRAVLQDRQRRAIAQKRKMGATRRRSPIRSRQRPVLEQVVKTYFDTEAFVAATLESNYFSRPQGQAAAAGNTKTLRDTNMIVAGQLPNPKVFVIVGFRVVCSGMTDDAQATPAFALMTATEAVLAYRAIVWETVTEFQLGQKIYVKRPTWQLPANAGLAMDGITSTNTAGGSIQLLADIPASLFASGPYLSYVRTRLRLPPLQSFSARIYSPRARVNGLPTNGVKVSLLLDGIEGREVQ